MEHWNTERRTQREAVNDQVFEERSGEKRENEGERNKPSLPSYIVKTKGKEEKMWKEEEEARENFGTKSGKELEQAVR